MDIVRVLQNILKWAEVWALLIPLYFILFKKAELNILAPVKYYVILSFIMYLCSELISNQKSLHLNLPWHNNGLFYNLQAITKFIFFSWYFLKLEPRFYSKFKRLIIACFVSFVLTYFIINKNSLLHFNSLLLGIEAVLLLVFCLLYYKQLSDINTDPSLLDKPDFLIVTGLGLYSAVNLFIFLLYNELSTKDVKFAVDVWAIPNVFFIIMCSFFGRAFFLSCRKNHRPIENKGVHSNAGII